MQESLDAVTRCPRCRALVPDGATWCTLCYSPVREERPAYDGVAPAAATDRPDGDAVDDRAARDGADDAVTGPVDLEAALPDEVERSASAMLAVLAAESGSPLGPLGSRLSTTQARVGLMVGGVVLCTLLLFVVMWAAGALL